MLRGLDRALLARNSRRGRVGIASRGLVRGRLISGFPRRDWDVGRGTNYVRRGRASVSRGSVQSLSLGGSFSFLLGRHLCCPPLRRGTHLPTTPATHTRPRYGCPQSPVGGINGSRRPRVRGGRSAGVRSAMPRGPVGSRAHRLQRLHPARKVSGSPTSRRAAANAARTVL